MRSMTSKEIRQAFLDYFASEGPPGGAFGSPLLPGGDSTLLFTNAGMNQFKDVFAGREKREYQPRRRRPRSACAPAASTTIWRTWAIPRATTPSSRCWAISPSATTSRSEAIEYAWELVVDVYGLPVDRLWFTVYTDDDDAAALWEEIGAAAGQDPPLRREGQLLVDGRDRALRPVLRDPLRPRARSDCSGTRRTGQRRGRRHHRDLEPGLHAVRSRRRGQAAPAAAALRRHRRRASNGLPRSCRVPKPTTRPICSCR